jgi:segregation and condensation protein B
MNHPTAVAVANTDDAGAPGATDAAADGAGETASALEGLARQHALAVEAMLISSSRPLSPVRLAQALGLAPMPEAPPVSAALPGPEGGAEGAPAVVVKPRRRRKGGDAQAPQPDEVIARVVELLNAQYAAGNRAFRVELLSGGYRVMTLPQFGPVLSALHNAGAESKLSRAAVETLAVIAYRQPVTRSALEAIRGVACGEVLRTLLDRRLVTIAGRAEELGRPLLYATTKQFLQAFGLASLKDLPSPSEVGLK